MKVTKRKLLSFYDTQRAAAAALGVHESQISRLEMNDPIPRVHAQTLMYELHPEHDWSKFKPRTNGR